MNHRKFLFSLFEAAVAQAHPRECVPNFLPTKKMFFGRTVVFGAGKASAEMAKVVEEYLPFDIEGLVVTRYGHSVPCKRIEITEAGHPIPDNNGMRAASKMLKIASELGKTDLVICLFSGGGSSLLSLPVSGLCLEDKQEITNKLLKSGASIHEINCVRKHLSAIKGGRLALACAPAKLLTLAISDVTGDDLEVIASGPTVADSSTFRDAFNVLKRYEITHPSSVLKHLKKADDETPKPGDLRLKNVENFLIATPRQSLEAAAKVAQEAGMNPIILSDCIEGESREIAKEHANLAKEIQKKVQLISKPVVLISGGETSVSVNGSGKGGPNTEYLLSLLLELKGQAGIWAISCDTDGIDGTEDNAGAFISPESFLKSKDLCIEPSIYLSRNDSYNFFSKLDSLIFTGPTFTNVNDFRAILVMPKHQV